MAGKDTSENKSPDAPKVKPLTKADVAALVKREVPTLDKDTKKPTGKTQLVAVKEDEIYSFAEYDGHVVVCTIDGQKLRGDK